MISIIVPVYNEEKNIGRMLRDLKDTLRKLTHFEIIVVNDGSTDETMKVLAETVGIKIISYPVNKGKGFALRKGIMQARGDIIGFIDGDGEISPRFLEQFYEEMKDGGADMVVGRKNNHKKSLVRKVFTHCFRLICRVLFGLTFETQAGIKLFNRKVKYLDIQNDGYLFDLELLLACKERNMNIKEIPVELRNIEKRNRIGWPQVLQMLISLIILKIGRTPCSSSQTCASQQGCGYYMS